MPLRNFVVIALSAIVCVACYSVATKNRYANLFAEALEVIERDALQDLPREELFTAAIQGMTQQLDEHSMYISGDMFRALDEDMNQQFGGVGMYVDNDPTTGRLVVLAPIPNTPAFEAAIQIGDEIHEIDGHKTEGMDRTEAIKLMRGPQGKPVQIVLKRDEQFLSKNLVRAAIPVPSVHGDWRNPDGTWNYFLKDDPRIGYIRLLTFGKKSTEELRAALGEIRGSVNGLILDLRNNSGGLLTAAIDISDMFLPAGKDIVKTRGRNKVLVEEFFSTSSSELKHSFPVVILVNRNSASASEIVAACLQDNDRAVIVGEQSWGKGTVQNLIPIERGRSALKLTIASFWRPVDRNIDRFAKESVESGVWGVQPNQGMEVELTEEELFENIRWRNQRDLAGLTNGKSLKTVNGQSDDAPTRDDSPTSDDTDDQDDNSESTADEKPVVPHVDRPLQKAKEYLQALFKKSIAA